MARGGKTVWRRIADGVGLVVLIGGTVLVIRLLTPATQLGAPHVIDGDSLRDGVEEIRLQGIDAPEYRQTCIDGKGKDYPCGKMAARHLRRLVSGEPVKCHAVDADRYDRTIAVCTAGDRDINEAMVEDGWAVALSKHTPAYLPAERRAQAARRGIWQGWFEDPALWRERNRGTRADGSGMPAIPPD